MKIFQLTVSFIEPTEAVITLKADTEEEAIARVKAEMEGQVQDLVVKEIKDVSLLVTEAPDNVVSIAEARITN
jgi:hypothetical protein